MIINELRIGNCVDNDSRVVSISCDDEIGDMVEVMDFIGGTMRVKEKELKPVILNEKLLVGLGGEELISLNDGYKRFNLHGIHLSISPADRDWFVEYVHQIPIKYLHTLQNYYFAIKQVELEIPY